MPLVKMNDVLDKAHKNGYAVGAFNVENFEMALAVVAAAEELNAPVILQTTSSTIKYSTVENYFGMLSAIAKTATVPVVIHLDHGNSYDSAQSAVKAGYTSVMIDGSTLPYEDNVAVTKKTVEMAHKAGIPVEAELGTVGGKEDDHVVAEKDALYTNPAQAKDFVQSTGIDSFAMAIGTSHGFYKGEPKLDFDRLEQIRVAVPNVYLVLHGGTGIPDESLTTSVKLGISKINFATELRDAYTKAVRTALEDPTIFDPKVYGRAGREAVKTLVMHKIKVCGTQEKA